MCLQMRLAVPATRVGNINRRRTLCDRPFWEYTESDSEGGESRSQAWGAARSYAIITSCICCLFRVNDPDRSITSKPGGQGNNWKSTNQSEGSVRIAELLLFSSQCLDLISFISTSTKVLDLFSRRFSTLIPLPHASSSDSKWVLLLDCLA
jgi:hypothetical protein